MSLIPSYLTSVERQYDNYPKNVTEEQKREIEDAIRQLLLKHEVLSPNQIYGMICNKVSCLKNAALWDYIWACVYRALDAVGEEVYRLSDSEQWKEKHRKKEERLSKLPMRYEAISDNDNQYREPGERIEYQYQNAMCSAYPGLFDDCDGNHDVEQKLRDAKVIRKNNKTDTEDCQFHIYFSTEKAAHAFVDRFNEWALAQQGKSAGEILELMNIAA